MLCILYSRFPEGMSHLSFFSFAGQHNAIFNSVDSRLCPWWINSADLWPESWEGGPDTSVMVGNLYRGGEWKMRRIIFFGGGEGKPQFVGSPTRD